MNHIFVNVGVGMVLDGDGDTLGFFRSELTG